MAARAPVGPLDEVDELDESDEGDEGDELVSVGTGLSLTGYDRQL